MPEPNSTPMTPPTALSVTASIRNWARMLLRFARTFGDADEHDVHHADAADDEADGSDGEHQNENQAADLVPQVEKIIGSEERKIVWFVVRKAALATEQVANLFHGFSHFIRVTGLGENDVVLVIGIELAERCDRHVRGVVFRVSAAGDSLFLFLNRANDS